jgi:hypothetical protein
MTNKIETGELVSGYQYVNVPAAGVIFQYHYAIISSRTVVRTQRLTDEQRRSNKFDFDGAQWTGTDLSPEWVRKHCEYIGNYPNPIRK